MMFVTRFLILFILTSLTPNALAHVCSKPPSPAEMDRNYYASLREATTQQKTRVVILPFQDGSATQGHDDVLAKGIGLLLNDLMSQTSKIALEHPFVVWNETDKQNLTHQNYFDDDASLKIAKALQATHVVTGMFQKRPQTIRYFIKVREVATGQMKGELFEWTTTPSNRFFSVSADAAIRLVAAISGKQLSRKSFHRFLKTAPSYEAFRYYVKGMASSHSYHQKNLKIAKVWFGRALSLNGRYEAARIHQRRVLYMLALIHKQMGLDISMITNEIRHNLKLALSAADSSPLTQRWVKANNHFSAGLSSYTAGRYQKAIKHLSQASQLLPEDGLAHYYLSLAYKAVGDIRSDNEKDLALMLNSCLN